MKRDPDMTNPVIQVKNLSVERDTAILRNIAWCVNAGENWVILGPNGSGKTSLLSAITGYLSPTAGDISVCGRIYGRDDWRELRKCIGVVSPAIHERISGAVRAADIVISGKYGAIGYWGAISAEDRRRAEKILGEIQCGHLAERPWVCLSQGERQRILIGRALNADLKLLILDEPCAGLDPVAREYFLAFIDRLAQSKASPSLILVTHHVDEITSAFDHILLLKDGGITASGEKRRVLNSDLLSKAYGAPVILTETDGRYGLAVPTPEK